MDGNMSVENYEAELNGAKLLAEFVSAYNAALDVPKEVRNTLVIEYHRYLLSSNPNHREHSPKSNAG